MEEIKEGKKSTGAWKSCSRHAAMWEISYFGNDRPHGRKGDIDLLLEPTLYEDPKS